VPLWLAVHFRQRQKCRIECPSWINVGKLVSQIINILSINIKLKLIHKEKLEELINAEKASESFVQMPNPHYMEITNVLLNW
jgi:hypothetical protein